MTNTTNGRLDRTPRLLVIAVVMTALGLLSHSSTLTRGGERAPSQARMARPIPPKPGYTGQGALIRPEGYREWIYVGTPITPNDLNPPAAPLHEFHNVYIHPNDFEYWTKTGTFSDGTVIVAESVGVGSRKATSGNGYFMGEFEGLEAAVKDSGRFKGEPGTWAYFSFGRTHPLTDTAEKLPAVSCNFCHRANAGEDFVFTQYYPVLRAAKGIGDSARR